MDKTTVALVSIVLILFVVIFGAYTYKVRADSQGAWQQPRIETGQPIAEVQPTSPQRVEEPPIGEQPVAPQPQKPSRKPIIGGGPIIGQPNPQPIQRPGIIFRRPIMGGKGGCGQGQGCGQGGVQEYIVPDSYYEY